MHSQETTLSTRRLARAVAVTAALILLPAAPAVAQPPAPDGGGSEHPRAEIAPSLLATARAATDHEPVQVVVQLAEQADLTEAWGDHAAVVDALRATAADSRATFTAAAGAQRSLASAEVVNSFWLTNSLLLELPGGHAAQQLDTLAELPAVASLDPNFEVEAIEPAPTSDQDVAIVDELTYGLATIEADRAWDELGLDGTGVRVATLDTGVEIDHPDLAGRMVTDDPSDPTHPGGWMELDREGNLVSSEPYDSGNHGTHVAGTIHGGDSSGVAIGVAPGAEMMHGQVLYGNTGTWAQVIAGMQWAIAPTDAAGQPAGEPADIVNMSLGATGFNDLLIEPVQALRAAGIFPAIAIGNNCRVGDTGSPGNVYESVAVGATDADDDVAGFSCGGVVERTDWQDAPAHWPDSYVKPDLSAPGADVYSAGTDGDYRYSSGTSMATPHVAGTVALMRSANPDLGIDELVDLLSFSSVWDDRYSADRPDTRYGIGRINAYGASRLASLDSGLSGTVTAAATGDPVAQATVTVAGTSVWADEDGTYRAPVPPGTYDVTVEAFGYESRTLAGVTVTDGVFEPLDVALATGPSGTVTGTVTYPVTGQPIPGAEVTLPGTPLRTTTGADGGYTLPAVPEGEYTVQVRAHDFPYPPGQPVTVTVDGTARADFALDAPLHIAYVGTSNIADLEIYFESRGVELTQYGYDPEDSGAQNHLDATAHPVILYGSWYSFIHPGEELFDQFLQLADDKATGVLFLGNSLGTNGIRNLSRLTGQPETVGGYGQGGGAPAYYEVTADHPVLDGFEVGDRIITDEVQDNAWIGYFDGYQGDGREMIADIGRSDDIGIAGGGIGVQQRDNSRHVLLGDHSPTANRMLPRNWSDDAETVFWNAVDWAGADPDPDQPIVTPWGLEVSDDEVLSGDQVEVSVNVTNVGGSTDRHELALELDGEDEGAREVELDAGETGTVSWTVDRQELGRYVARVADLSTEFRVRAPAVQLSATTVDGTGAPVGPLAGADVELITSDGEVATTGRTDGAGELRFETTAPEGEYTLVVRRPERDGHPYGYLLTRELHIDADTEVAFAPSTGESAPDGGADRAAVVDLDARRVTDEHEARAYLRPAATAGYGFGFAPGQVVVTAGDYDVRHLHAVADTWVVSEILPARDFRAAGEHRHRFGGDVSTTVQTSGRGDSEFTISWTAADRADNPVEVVLHGGTVDPAGLPESAPLAELPDRLGAGHQATGVELRFDRPGAGDHVEQLDWQQREVTGDLADRFDPVRLGAYLVAVTPDTGAYPPGEPTGQGLLVVTPTRP